MRDILQKMVAIKQFFIPANGDACEVITPPQKALETQPQQHPGHNT